MISLLRHSRRAVTLTELLVVLVIISLLATIAVPVYVQKAEQARIAITRSEVRSIAEAEESCALVHGFYVPMHTLDNIPKPSGSAPSGISRDTFEDDPDGTLNRPINPFSNLNTQVGAQTSLSGTDIRVQHMIQYWQGPFLNPTRVFKNGGSPGSTNVNNPYVNTQLSVSRDYLLDGWGRPYRMFSPIGVTGTTAVPTALSTSASSLDDTGLDNGQLTTNTPRYDRWAIVSFGSNGIVDSNSGTNVDDDDIFYTFGSTPNESAFNAF